MTRKVACGSKLLGPSLSERRLIGAIIEQSFRDIHSVDDRLRISAIRWLSSPVAVQYAEIVGIDGDVLARGVRRHMEISASKGRDVSYDLPNGFAPSQKNIRPGY